MRSLRAVLSAALAAALAAAPASAARPLLDQHQWDRYFALFARDVSVPWKPATLRLDTYSGAPVDFAAYAVDPADVIVAGQSRSARALDTARLAPVARWRFSPPSGYRFETSDVAVPLGEREGFFVIEARRGDAVQQIWLDRTHVGLVTQESAQGLVLWGADLRSGRAIPGMRVSFLVGLRLVTLRTDARGMVVWRGRERPTFALAESGHGRAFVSLLPQAPVPRTVVGLRLESGAVRAGEPVRFVGFSRTLAGGAFARGSGTARVSLFGRGRTLAAATAPLDAAGAFAGALAVPAGVEAGDYAVVATAGGGAGGSDLHVDAAGDVSLAVRAACPCDPGGDVPLAIEASRGGAPAAGVPVRVEIVRSPHVLPPGAPDAQARWGTTAVLARTVRTDASGGATVVVPVPSDGLDSTYGVRATARGASATARVVVPMTPTSLALEPEATSADVGAPVAFLVRGFGSADGAPAAGLAVHVTLSHGASTQTRDATLDRGGAARVVFARTSLGSNLAVARADVGAGHALDAAAVVVEPSALFGRTLSDRGAVALTPDRARYRPGESVSLTAAAGGANGDALLALGGTGDARLASVRDGEARASLPLGTPRGGVSVTAAFVRDGAIALGTLPLAIDGPGRPRDTALALDRATYAPGDVLHLELRDGGERAGATVAVRVADGRESGAATFENAPDVLAVDQTTAQAPASDDPEWHGYVVPARSRASDIFAAERPRKVTVAAPTLGAAAPRTLYWRVARVGAGAALDVPAPASAGHFVVSVLKIGDDGDVGAASASFDVR